MRFRKTEPRPLTEQRRLRAVHAFQPQKLVLAVAGEVIRKADRVHPADAALRVELAARRGLAQAIRGEVSRAVFAYYRWRGWLDRKKPLEFRVAYALELAERFSRNPFTLPEKILRAKAIPAWAAGEMDCPVEWLRSLQRQPRIWLRARRARGMELARKISGTRRNASLPDALSYEGTEDLFQTGEFRAGEFELQDIASQAVAFLCDPRPGETWWDACAGEGGKTLHLSDLMENQGLIWATDRAAWRLKNLKRRAARARVFNYRALLWDGGSKLPTKTRFDGVLVDAPCSGVGTWQRNPHTRWTTTPADTKDLSGTQKRLLAHVAPAVKPGGKLVYAVCTLTRAETVEVAAAFEREFPEFQPWPQTNPFLRDETSAKLLLWPQETGGNGMFIAVWRKPRAASPSV